MTEKERDLLQLELWGAHREATKQDERHRSIIRTDLINSERRGWWIAWGEWCRSQRGESRLPTLNPIPFLTWSPK